MVNKSLFGSRQLIPSSSFELDTNGVAKLLRVVSLGAWAPQGWTSDREHWFKKAGENVRTRLAAKQDVILTLRESCDPQASCPPILDVISELSQPAHWTPQIATPEAVLEAADWSQTAPTPAGEVWYYTGTSPENTTIRLALVTSGGNLVQTIWLAPSNQVQAYFTDKKKDSSTTLVYQTTSLPAGNWYYYSSP